MIREEKETDGTDKNELTLNIIKKILVKDQASRSH